MAGDEKRRAEIERRTERWFVRQGIPHFIERYNALTDIFTRAAGFLYIVFILQILNGMNLDWPGWANALALVASTVIMLGGIALLNHSRGRPWYRRPNRIGPVELSAFVFLPAVLPILFGTQFASALGILVGNVALLAVTYVLVSYGVFPMLRWAIAQTFRQIADLLNVMMSTLPLLLLFTMFMFLNAELWDVVDEIPADFFVLSVGMLVVLGSVLLLVQLPSEVGHVARFDTWAEIDDLVEGTPLETVGVDGLADPPEATAPTRRARANVGLLLYFGQAMQVLLVSVVIGLFYFAFGLVTVSETTIELWTGSQDLDVVANWSILGHHVPVTADLIRASIFVAGIAGLQFVVSALRDEDYRKEFARDVIGDLRRVFAVRALYLARVYDGGAVTASTDP